MKATERLSIRAERSEARFAGRERRQALEVR